jgi:putative transposase
MAAPHSLDPAQLAEHLASASPDMLREMVAPMANALMSMQVDQLCGAEYGDAARTQQLVVDPPPPRRA